MSHGGRKDRHPYCSDLFWMKESNMFWRNNGVNYTQASIERFEKIVEQARTANERWQKGGEIDRLIARK